MKRIALRLVMLVLVVGTVVPGCDGKSPTTTTPSTSSPPPQAIFSVSNLSIEPVQVEANETVTISLTVANTGGSQGSHDVVLNINGEQEEAQSVTIAAGSSQSITFSVTREGVGSYTVAVDGLTGSFAVVEQVTFADSNLEAAIRQALNKSQGPIYTSDLESLTTLEAQERGISDISGLEYCLNLEVLYLGINNISDISPLAGLTNLEELYLSSNNISDTSALAGLANLGLLDLGTNNISDISTLAGLTNLEELILWENNISDISALAGLTNLELLVLKSNNIIDISPLAGLTNLEVLVLWENNISDISPLAGLTNLSWLLLSRNNISDISPLAGLTNLEWLVLEGNNISDISPLVENIGLSAGDMVYLRDNPLSTESVNTYIPQLEQRGVIVVY